MWIGREVPARRLLELVDRARGGRSGVLVVSGEAGIGKSTLLGETADAADGFTVLRDAGGRRPHVTSFSG